MSTPLETHSSKYCRAPAALSAMSSHTQTQQGSTRHTHTAGGHCATERPCVCVLPECCHLAHEELILVHVAVKVVQLLPLALGL